MVKHLSIGNWIFEQDYVFAETEADGGRRVGQQRT